MNDKHFAWDYGLALVVESGSDLSAFTRLELLVQKPDGTRAAWVATRHQTSKALYIVKNGDFDQTGQYEVQIRATKQGARLHGTRSRFTLLGPIPLYVRVRGRGCRLAITQNSGRVE